MCLSETGTAFAPHSGGNSGHAPMSSAPVREPAIDTTYVQGGPRHGAAKHGPRAVGGARAMGSAPRTPHVLVVSAREHPVAAALEQHGYVGLRARTGAAAAAAVNDAQQAPPDALLVIDGMPDVEGLVLAQRLRDAARLPPDTPIFVVAPSPPTVPQHRAALRAGVCEFLLEPLDGDHLAAKLASRLLGSDAQGAMTLAARLLQAVEGGTGEPGDPAPRVRLHAGYDAVPNARYAPLGPEDLLARAVRALRRARASGASIGAPAD